MSFPLPTDPHCYKKVKKNSGTDFKQVIDAYLGEKPIFIPPNATYDTEKITITSAMDGGVLIGGSLYNTTIRPKDASQTPLFTIGELASGSRTEQLLLRNFCVDMRGYADAKAFQLQNVVASLFRLLQLVNYTIGFHIEGFDGTDYSFWNSFENIMSANPSSLATRRLFHVATYAIDSWIDRVWGDVKGGMGLEMWSGESWTVKEFWVTDCATSIWLEGMSGNVQRIIIDHPIIDNPTSFGIVLKFSNYNLTRCNIKKPFFINVPAAKDLIYIVGGAGKVFSRNVIKDGFDGATSIHRYAVNYDNVGTFENSNRFVRNKFTTGASGLYNNIPTSCIVDDDVFRNKYYQTQTDVSDVAPTWIGTPLEGEKVTVYNSTTGHHIIWTYSNGGWHKTADLT